MNNAASRFPEANSVLCASRRQEVIHFLVCILQSQTKHGSRKTFHTYSSTKCQAHNLKNCKSRPISINYVNGFLPTVLFNHRLSPSSNSHTVSQLGECLSISFQFQLLICTLQDSTISKNAHGILVLWGTIMQ